MKNIFELYFRTVRDPKYQNYQTQLNINVDDYNPKKFNSFWNGPIRLLRDGYAYKANFNRKSSFSSCEYVFDVLIVSDKDLPLNATNLSYDLIVCKASKGKLTNNNFFFGHACDLEAGLDSTHNHKVLMVDVGISDLDLAKQILGQLNLKKKVLKLQNAQMFGCFSLPQLFSNLVF
jgi:hypothetical protein